MNSEKKTDSNLLPNKKSSNTLFSKIVSALRTLEQNSGNPGKPGFTVRKIAKHLRHDYHVADHNYEMRIRFELERMAEMGFVVRNSHTKDVWKSTEHWHYCKRACKVFIEELCPQDEQQFKDEQWRDDERRFDDKHNLDEEEHFEVSDPKYQPIYEDAEQQSNNEQCVHEVTSHEEAGDSVAENGSCTRQILLKPEASRMVTRAASRKSPTTLLTSTSETVRSLDSQCQAISQNALRSFFDKFTVVGNGMCSCKNCTNIKVGRSVAPCNDPEVSPPTAELGGCETAEDNSGAGTSCRRQAAKRRNQKRYRSPVKVKKRRGYNPGEMRKPTGTYNPRPSILKNCKKTCKSKKRARHNVAADEVLETGSMDNDGYESENRSNLPSTSYDHKGCPSRPSTSYDQLDYLNRSTSADNSTTLAFISDDDDRASDCHQENNFLKDTCVIM